MSDNSYVVEINGSYRVMLKEFGKARVGDCRDCLYFQGHVSWWCKNTEAREHYNTLIPGREDCQFWKEAWREETDISKFDKNMWREYFSSL